MAKTRWIAERVIGEFRVYARMARAEIAVRVEYDGDTTKYAECGYPKTFGIVLAMEQAARETRPHDIRE